MMMRITCQQLFGIPQLIAKYSCCHSSANTTVYAYSRPGIASHTLQVHVTCTIHASARVRCGYRSTALCHASEVDQELWNKRVRTCVLCVYAVGALADDRLNVTYLSACIRHCQERANLVVSGHYIPFFSPRMTTADMKLH